MGVYNKPGQHIYEFQKHPDLVAQEMDARGQTVFKPDGSGVLCSFTPNRVTCTSPDLTAEPGHFQAKVKDCLSSGDFRAAVDVIQKYIQNPKFIRLQNIGTGKIHILKALTRFDAEYVYRVGVKLKGLQKVGVTSIQHITLTMAHPQNADYVGAYAELKKNLTKFIAALKRQLKNPGLKYISTFETTISDEGQYHMHIHLIVFEVGYIPKKNLLALKKTWLHLGGAYLFFRYISAQKNHRAYEYALKYIVKEVGQIHATSALLFSVGGRAFTLSIPLQKIISDEETHIMGSRYKYLNSFFADEVFLGYAPAEYDSASLTWFRSITVDMFAEVPPDSEVHISGLQGKIEVEIACDQYDAKMSSYFQSKVRFDRVSPPSPEKSGGDVSPSPEKSGGDVSPSPEKSGGDVSPSPEKSGGDVSPSPEKSGGDVSPSPEKSGGDVSPSPEKSGGDVSPSPEKSEDL